MKRYPLEPFFAATGWTMKRANEASGSSAPNGVEYQLRKTEGVTALVADRIATAAGLHPAEVWPEWWEDGTEAALERHGRDCEECGSRYLPRNIRSRYCSPRCRATASQRRYRATNPHAMEAARAARRRYYQECGEYERAAERRRYWSDPEGHRARKREARTNAVEGAC